MLTVDLKLDHACRSSLDRVGQLVWSDHAAGVDLDEEQHVEPLEGDGVDGEEVTRDHADRRRGERVAEPDEFAVDAPVSRRRVLDREANHQSAYLRVDRGPSGWAVRVGPAASLFIDMIGRLLSPMSIAGVR